MKTTRSVCHTLCGALVWLTSASVPWIVVAAPAVDEMSPAELRALFHAPGFGVPDELGTSNEDYRSVASRSEEIRQHSRASLTVSGADRDAICVALGDALNSLRGRAVVSRRVAYGSDSGIVRWYQSHCLIQQRVDGRRAAKAFVDPVTLKALRRIALTHPKESLDAY